MSKPPLIEPAWVQLKRQVLPAGRHSLLGGRRGSRRPKPFSITCWLLLGSGVMALSSSHQSRDEGAEEGFASAPGVMHELEEGEVQRQLLLRDAPVRAEPGAQQGPRPLHGVDVDLDRKSTRLNSSHANISYAVFCLKKKKHTDIHLVSVNELHTIEPREAG